MMGQGLKYICVCTVYFICIAMHAFNNCCFIYQHFTKLIIHQKKKKKHFYTKLIKTKLLGLYI